VRQIQQQKTQPCDIEPTFESIDPIIVNIIDSGVSHGNIVVISSLKPFKNLLHVIYLVDFFASSHGVLVDNTCWFIFCT
jgi:hypothetical protein